MQDLECSVRTYRCDQQQFPPASGTGPVLLLGGSMGVAERRQYPDLQWTIEWLATAVAAGRPILAICLGGQLLAHSQGGQVYRQQHQERGISAIELIALGCNDPLFAGLDPPLCQLWDAQRQF